MSENNNKAKAEEFCDHVNSFSKNKLNNKEDLVRLTEVIFENDKNDIMNNLVFNAKYSQGLIKIVQQRTNDFEDEYFEKIKAEYTETIKKIKSDLDLIIKDTSSFYKKIFEEKYMQLTHESMSNLKGLIDDLSWVKMFLNDEKRNN